jgi:hypothetical protein
MRTYRLTCLVVALGLAGAMGCAGDRSHHPSRHRAAAQPISDDADQAVRRLLNQPLSVAYNDKFEAVLAHFADATRLPMSVNWEAIQLLGVERSTKVTLTAKGWPAETVLGQLLAGLSSDPTNPIRHVIRDGIVVVDTDQNVRLHHVTRVYNIGDLLTPDARPDATYVILVGVEEKYARSVESLWKGDFHPPARTVHDVVEEAKVRRRIAGVVLEESRFPDTAAGREARERMTLIDAGRALERSSEESRKERAERLLMMIQTNIGRVESWEEAGGSAVARVEDDVLVVKTTPEDHELLAQFLSDLRAAKEGAKTPRHSREKRWR